MRDAFPSRVYVFARNNNKPSAPPPRKQEQLAGGCRFHPSSSSPPDACEEERYESAVEVDRKAQVLADRIRASKHFLVFTGAGISTSAGQPRVASY